MAKLNASNQRKYYCTHCGAYKWIPGRDSDLSRTIRTGCDSEWCGTIRTFKKVGVL